MAVPVHTVSFVLNGQPVVVQGASPLISLNEWLRSQPQLWGTKLMCGEGGCGCCVVAITRQDPVTGADTTIAVNSCLCPLYSVEGWKITTVEGIGNSKVGYHPIQQKIAEHNGSQCGYCTPGMVMSMYSLLQKNSGPTEQQVEDNFDGNICRCTGYRPIFDAMKTFAVDSTKTVAVPDLEELTLRCSGKDCSQRCHQHLSRPLNDSGPWWYRPIELTEVFAILQMHTDYRVKLITGDTGRGVFKAPEKIDILVDLKGIPVLSTVEVHDYYLKVGAAITIASLIDLLVKHKDRSPNTFEYLASHLRKIASTPVRNVASWAGNLMLTHNHANFPSDVATIMTAVGATVTIQTLTNTSSCIPKGRVCQKIAHVGMTLLGLTDTVTGEYPLPDFLQLDMSNSMIVSMQIPFASGTTVFRSYKIMPRAENAHAIVNAAFNMEVDPATLQVTSIPLFVFGGIGTHVISCKGTESFLTKKYLHDLATLQGAVEALSNEIAPVALPAGNSPQYRKNLAINLFYKFYLAALGKNASASVQSAAVPFTRPVSSGSQSYGTNPSEYPITQPTTKLTALQQASGEAEYTTDLPAVPGELAAAFVLTTVANAKITGIDIDAAMAMPGAVKVLTAADIPSNGKNNFTNWQGYNPEEVLAQDTSQYAGQAVALVLADTQQNANRMAQAVSVSYQTLGKPILTIAEAIENNSFFDSPAASDVIKTGNSEDAISKSENIISDELSCESQYHFTMETQIALCCPVDDGYTVYSSTQWPQLTQIAVATILGVSSSCVNVSVKRVGGGYGAKVSRSQHIAAACALGAYVTGRPVRMHMDIDTNMRLIGKRYPFYMKYKVGCTSAGILNGVEISLYNDAGYIDNDNSLADPASKFIDNTYKCANWTVTPKSCKTNNCSNTYCRAPGYAPAIFFIESIMANIADSLGLDVEQVKRANLYQQGDISPTVDPQKGGMPLKYCNIQQLWDDMMTSADVENRTKEIVQFNRDNRWRKRGISVVPLKYGLAWDSLPYSVLVSVYASDGSVAVVHGGVEIGQGINTKVAQVVAKTLGVPLDLVKVKPTNVLCSPNSQMTAGSVTSGLNCKGALQACTTLKARIDDVKKKMGGTPTWQEVVMKCYQQGVDLSEKSFVCEHTEYTVAYNSYGVTCTEVEVDVLTGCTEILRVDMLYDCGESINPEIDIGQAEGAFVMGLGYYMTEKLKYDADTGALLTHNTWEYKPPSSKDIPIDFRVSLLKNAPNPVGVLRSKAVGEPPLCMSCSALFAIKKAIQSARAESGSIIPHFSLRAPATVEDVQLACSVDKSQFIL